MTKRTKVAVLLFVLIAIAIPAILWLSRDKDPFTSQPAPQLPTPPLKELAERKGVQIGSFASLKYLRERAYTDILSDQFEYAIVDGEPNWKFEDFTLRPTKDTFDFADMDQVFDFADQQNMPVRVQHLVWGDDKWLPDWLKQGNFSKPELMDILRKHITTVAGRYKGRVREYSVVNEAFSRKLITGGNHDWWGEHLDQDYIDKSFIWAREADPDAILLLNDFGNETEGEISNLMYDYIKSAKARGVPIDGIGMQMHIDATKAPPKEDVIKNMKRFNDIGVKVYITEFDVNMHFVNDSVSNENQQQAKIYSELLGACLEVGPVGCPNFGFLGLIDRQSWYQGIGLDDANPLLFNDDYSPKPAFYAVRNALMNY